MTIKILEKAVKESLDKIKGARPGKEIDHKKVEEFQTGIKDWLNNNLNGYKWDIEVKFKGRTEKDSVDILGKAKNEPTWIIEIDATRSDQVSQKFLSRLALWGLKDPIQYIAILYPDANNGKGKNACEKYLRYSNQIIKKINQQSSVIGIFVDPDKDKVNIKNPNAHSRFTVDGKECNSMNAAVAEAIKNYLVKKPCSYNELQEVWGRFVSNTVGTSRYKNIGITTNDGVTVHTYTQFRQYGTASYWQDFIKLCKKNKIKLSSME